MPVSDQCLFLIVPWVYLKWVIVALPGHTHLLLILETNMLFSIFREDLVVLGTFKQKGRGDTEILLSETEDILSRCKRLVPSLKVLS